MSQNWPGDAPQPDPALAQLFEPELLPGERVLWTGRPRPRFLYPTDLALLIFLALPFGFVAVMYFSLRTEPTMPRWFPVFLFGFPTVLVLPIAAGIVIPARRIRRMAYALTGQRAIFLTPGTNRRARSVYLNQMQSSSISRGKDGYGSIRFGESSPVGSWGSSVSRIAAPTFLEIPNVDAVYRLVNTVREGAG